MKKVYLVTSGSYSDYSVNAAFSSVENAKVFIDYYTKKRTKRDFYEDFDIEEYDLDMGIKDMKNNLPLFHIVMKKDGESTINNHIHYLSNLQLPELIDDGLGQKNLVGTILAKSKEHAIKIFNDKRAQLIANGKWV